MSCKPAGYPRFYIDGKTYVESWRALYFYWKMRPECCTEFLGTNFFKSGGNLNDIISEVVERDFTISQLERLIRKVTNEL